MFNLYCYSSEAGQEIILYKHAITNPWRHWINTADGEFLMKSDTSDQAEIRRVWNSPLIFFLLRWYYKPTQMLQNKTIYLTILLRLAECIFHDCIKEKSHCNLSPPPILQYFLKRDVSFYSIHTMEAAEYLMLLPFLSQGYLTYYSLSFLLLIVFWDMTLMVWVKASFFFKIRSPSFYHWVEVLIKLLPWAQTS